MHKITILLACLALAGCAMPLKAPMNQDFSASSMARAYRSPDEPSLFSSDASVVSDADIAKILAHRYAPPARSRLAILPFGWSDWAGWSEEMALSTQEVNAKVISVLKASPKIADASFLPSILVPEKRNVAFLREAAARYQADLLLVFRSACRTFEKTRVLKPDEARAFCGIEAVLLDTRTGLVPFTATATRNHDVKQMPEDFNFREAVLRSQLASIAAALGDVSTQVVAFLAKDHPS
jgi:hypothetical protein